jgi:hypothetical protein
VIDWSVKAGTQAQITTAGCKPRTVRTGPTGGRLLSGHETELATMTSRQIRPANINGQPIITVS